MSKLATFPNTTSVQNIQKNYRQLFDAVKRTKTPLFITRNNVPDVVVVDTEVWSEIATKQLLAEELETLQAVKAFKLAKSKNKTKKLGHKLSDLLK